MARVKRGVTKRARHKKILAQNKGYRGTKSKLFRVAKEASLHAGDYAFAGRKQRKQQKRTLWISQINAALKMQGVSYNAFIKNLKDAKIEIDRKILADLANEDAKTFSQIVSKVSK